MNLRQHRFLKYVLASFAIALPNVVVRGQDIYEDGASSVINAPSVDIEVRDSASALPTTVTIEDGAQVGFVLNPDGTLAMQDDGGGGMQPIVSNGSRSVLVTGASVVNMTGGVAAVSFDLSDTATATISGGEIGDNLNPSGSSTVVFSGGIISDDIEADGMAVVQMSGTARVDDDAFFDGSSRLEASAGQFDDELQFFGNSTALFTGGNVDDDLVVADSSHVVIQSLNVDDSIEASGVSTTDVYGGTFGNIFASGDFNTGPTVNFYGGSTESISAVLGATVNIGAATLPADFSASASLGGKLSVDGAMASNLTFGAANGSKLAIDDITATQLGITASSAGIVSINGGVVDELDLLAELNGEVVLRGGDFASATARVEGAASFSIHGSEFTYNGIPIHSLNDVLGDGAYIDETGELRAVAGTIAGILQDGSPFSLSFSRQFSPVDSAGSIYLVPEPSAAVVALLGFCGVVSLRRL